MNSEAHNNLTACLLVYNHAHLLDQVIQSILNQNFNDFLLLISDDCSLDNSFEVAKSFENKDRRVRAIKTPNNLGMAGNANYAINLTNSEFVALLHHDDILNRDTFIEWLKCINLSERIAFVFNDYRTSKSDSTNRSINRKLQYKNSGQVIFNKFLIRKWASPVRGTALIRKKYFDEIGGMKAEFGMLADVDLWMRLAARWDVGYVAKPLIEVLEVRPDNYPKDYTGFSWKRIFFLFDIHSSNINRENFPNYIYYLYKRLAFKNKVSTEIIKWHLYSLIKGKKEIIKSFPGYSRYEYFYSRIIRIITRLLIIKK